MEEETLVTSDTTTRTLSTPYSSSRATAAGFKRRTKRRLSETNATIRQEEEEDEEEEVKEKIEALQRIIPGGTSLSVDALFEETAGYIISLQCQIKTIKVLTSFIQHSDNDQDMKFGG